MLFKFCGGMRAGAIWGEHQETPVESAADCPCSSPLCLEQFGAKKEFSRGGEVLFGVLSERSHLSPSFPFVYKSPADFN